MGMGLLFPIQKGRQAPTQRMEVSMPVPRKRRQRFSELQHSKEMESLQWLIEAMKTPQTVSWTEKIKLRPRDTAELLSKVANGPQRERKKALLILARLLGITISTLCLALKTSPATVGRHWKKFNDEGAEGLFRERPRRIPKAEDETIKAVCLLHDSLPSIRA